MPPAHETSSEVVIARYDTSLSAYQLEGGRWFADTILVNEDFDFASAMSLNGIGAGLAAHKRVTNNEAKREVLQSLSLSRALFERLDALRNKGAHAFFLLWGTYENSTLMLVVDSVDGCPTGIRTGAAEGKTRSISGLYGWAAPGVLEADALELLQVASRWVYSVNPDACTLWASVRRGTPRIRAA